MAGHNNNKTTPLQVSFSRTLPEPIDKYANISNLSNIATEIPSAIRYVGMMVFDENTKKYYHFKDGIADNNLVGWVADGIRTFDKLVNTTANTKIEVKHDLGAANLMVSFSHNDELILVGWKRGKIDGTDKGNYIHFSTSTSLTGLNVFIISKDLAPTQPTHPNLDNELSAITTKLNTTHTDLDTLQEVGDAIKANQTSISSINTKLTTTNSNYDTFQEISDAIVTMSASLRPVETTLSLTSANLLTNGAITAAFNSKIADAPNDTNTYARKGAAWVQITPFTVDTALNGTSTNPVENKAVTTALNAKIGDAPSNGKPHARKDATWVEIQSDLQDPNLYTFQLASVTASNNLILRTVKNDGTVISKTLDNAYIGSDPATKGGGWEGRVEVIGSKLLIIYVDNTTSVANLIIFDDFYVDEFNNTFVFSKVTVKITNKTVPQYAVLSVIHAEDFVYIMFSGEPSEIRKYTAHDFTQVGAFSFPNHLNWNNASNAHIYGDHVYFVAGKPDYLNHLRVSRIKKDFSAYNLVIDVTENASAKGLPSAGMFIENGNLFLLQSTANDTKFFMLKYDIVDPSAPKLLYNVQHNYVIGDNRGMAFGMTEYGDRLFIAVNWIDTLPSNADRQLWSLKKSDLTVLERMTLADNSGLMTIDRNGKLIWAVSNQGAYRGDSDNKLLSVDPMNLSTAPTVIADIPTTERWVGMSHRVTKQDELRNLGVTPIPQNGGVQYLKPTVSGATTAIDIKGKQETIVECDINQNTDFQISNFSTTEPATVKFVLRRANAPATIDVKFSGTTRVAGVNTAQSHASFTGTGISMESSDSTTHRRYFTVICDITPHPTVTGQTVMLVSHGVSHSFII